MSTTALSTLGRNTILRNDISQLQSSIGQMQHQIATGKKADRYGDLGATATLDISLRNQGEQINSFKQTISVLQVRTDMIDKTLLGIRDIALALRNQAVGVQPVNSSRQDLINSAKDALAQITDKLQVSVDGRMLFGGTKTGAAPMVDSGTVLSAVQTGVNTALGALPVPPAAGTVSTAVQGAVASVFSTTANFYQGGAKFPATQIAPGYSVNYSVVGSDPAFQDILQGLYMIASTPLPVQTPSAAGEVSEPDFDATMSAAATLMGGGVDKLDVLTQQNGHYQKTLSDVSDTHDTTLTIIGTQIDNIENTDIYDTTTRLTALQTQLQATFSLVGELRSLNLIDYLK
jgi:flagellar hook-associated protein 3 FlgL